MVGRAETGRNRVRAGSDGAARRRVQVALDRLPERDRELIKLAYWSEFSQRELAAQLGVSVGTVKARTRCALTRLAELLDETGASGAPPRHTKRIGQA